MLGPDTKTFKKVFFECRRFLKVTKVLISKKKSKKESFLIIYAFDLDKKSNQKFERSKTGSSTKCVGAKSEWSCLNLGGPKWLEVVGRRNGTAPKVGGVQSGRSKLFFILCRYCVGG